MKDGMDYEAECYFVFILCLRDCTVISEDAMDQIGEALLTACTEDTARPSQSIHLLSLLL